MTATASISTSPWLSRLSAETLRKLAKRLRSGTLELPCNGLQLTQVVPAEEVDATVTALNGVHTALGLTADQFAWTLDVLASERTLRFVPEDIDLVWSGPEVTAEHSRETGTVVREMFSSAQHRVLVASYVIDTSTKGQDIFRPLADQMAALPLLTARCFFSVLNPNHGSKSDALKKLFFDFKDKVWPVGVRLPALFYDPRSLLTGSERACLHAKCVVIDGEAALITSANFTQAAHLRNIEAGALVRRRVVARALERQFDNLLQRGELLPLQPPG
jgi:phosphatidylserine/phosphatidylglycerophosphate/cardiolipin synthase-like enzyme